MTLQRNQIYMKYGVRVIPFYIYISHINSKFIFHFTIRQMGVSVLSFIFTKKMIDFSGKSRKKNSQSFKQAICSWYKMVILATLYHLFRITWNTIHSHYIYFAVNKSHFIGHTQTNQKNIWRMIEWQPNDEQKQNVLKN